MTITTTLLMMWREMLYPKTMNACGTTLAESTQKSYVSHGSSWKGMTHQLCQKRSLLYRWNPRAEAPRSDRRWFLVRLALHQVSHQVFPVSHLFHLLWKTILIIFYRILYKIFYRIDDDPPYTSLFCSHSSLMSADVIVFRGMSVCESLTRTRLSLAVVE